MPKTETVLDSIRCPGCGEVIPISETIYHQVVERAERDLKAKSVRQERALAERERQLQAREADSAGHLHHVGHVRGFAGPDRILSAQHPCTYPSGSGLRGGRLMLCDTCRWTGRPGFVRAPGTVQEDLYAMIPCPDVAVKGSLTAAMGFANSRTWS
jgi:hypothetical protein